MHSADSFLFLNDFVDLNVLKTVKIKVSSTGLGAIHERDICKTVIYKIFLRISFGAPEEKLLDIPLTEW